VPTTERRVAAYHRRMLIPDLNMPGELSLPAIPPLRHIQRKTGRTTRTALVAYAREHDVI
jgi:hypothetical protein